MLFRSGKQKPLFTPHVDGGDFVVVVNADKVRLTGRKQEQKIYTRYTGYPSGLRKRTAREMRAIKPGEIVRHAVKGMLPKSQLDNLVTFLEALLEAQAIVERVQRGLKTGGTPRAAKKAKKAPGKK